MNRYLSRWLTFERRRPSGTEAPARAPASGGYYLLFFTAAEYSIDLRTTPKHTASESLAILVPECRACSTSRLDLIEANPMCLQPRMHKLFANTGLEL
jgi:hypothetical protein